MSGSGWRRLLATLLVVTLPAIGIPVAALQPSAGSVVELKLLPPEARQTLRLIERGGPYPHRRDGAVFGNYERLLPSRDRGYYREYTVATPGATGRGARRIVAGRDGERYYTDDHYRSFHRVRE